jgi:lipopolysaccharide transport system ATP-binding protein
MAGTTIAVHGLGKRYPYEEQQAAYATLRGSLRRAVTGWGRRARAIEFMWALRDVDFSIAAGEVVGLIGRNGSGKSTLLKILSRITRPTAGRATILGRVGSLLEVGTGFNRELSGRDNVFLNGAILGMRRAEILRKMDQILAFAEVERYADTPVKHYSSGMYVRLAFAVAAHLDVDVLLVDEVLAVGDLAFQKKCLGVVGAAARSGRTVMFVSHNLQTLQVLCRRGLLLDQGRLVADGPMKEVSDTYVGGVIERARSDVTFEEDPARPTQILAVRVLDRAGRPAATHEIGAPITVEMSFVVRRPFANLQPSFRLATSVGEDLFWTHEVDTVNAGTAEMIDEVPKQPGRYVARATIPAPLLNTGRYELELELAIPRQAPADRCDGVMFEIADTGGSFSSFPLKQRRVGFLALTVPWYVERIDS